ncbi:hypothetical protein JTB14_012986 [Gonioctena quinquepunctata]|nr:hypothetical protein JTB14_012986 [Gonioctena quinquepunctata]
MFDMPHSMTVLFFLLLLSTFAKSTSPTEATSVPTNATSPPVFPKAAACVADDDPLDSVIYYDDIVAINDRSKKDAKIWDHWGRWSACSVSCGVGKMTRWRHCVSRGCASGEKEAQIKTCDLSPC